jgi:hypothetical protein
MNGTKLGFLRDILGGDKLALK